MENANPSCSTSNKEFLNPKKKEEIESWLGDSRIIDSLDESNEIKYFDTFPTKEELEYHEWILKYPKPSWVKAKIRTGNLNNVKISCKMGHFLKRQAYIVLESPINVMSKQHMIWVHEKDLESETETIQPKDTTSIIDHHLGEVVFGKPFAWNTSPRLMIIIVSHSIFGFIKDLSSQFKLMSDPVVKGPSQVNGNTKQRVTKGKDDVYRVLPSTTQEEQFADEKERKARTLLLMAVPKDHLRHFHGMDDAKEIWGSPQDTILMVMQTRRKSKTFRKEHLRHLLSRLRKGLRNEEDAGSCSKSQRVVHADVRQATPAWTNTNRVNKANQFTPRPVQLILLVSWPQIKTGSFLRFNTGKQNVNSGSVHVNTARVNRPVSNQTSYKTSPKLSQAKWALLVKILRRSSTDAYEHKSNFDIGNVLAHDCKVSISGKGTIRLGNVVFDEWLFVKELGQFNPIFSISQICDKKAKRNKPMTQSQLRTYMMNYLKNQGTWKLSQLKNLSFEEVKEEFDKLVKQVESFAPINFEATKDSLKRFGEELQTKTSKRLKSDEEKDDEPTKKTGKRRKQMARKGLHTDLDKDDSEDSDEACEQDDSASGTKILINPVPVAMKSPSIVTYKIIKQGERGVYQIVREDGTDIVYINFGAMLKDITRDDLTELYRIVMNRYGMSRPEDELEKVIWEYLKNMFEEPLSTDPIWSLLGQQRIISWRYYDTCRVHCLNLESMDIYILIERQYPLSAEVCKAMLDKKLQGGKPDENCYKMLKKMEKQAGIRK
ncbi:hypothetical protein Tco_0183907 [Tanacetum coccineum]